MIRPSVIEVSKTLTEKKMYENRLNFINPSKWGEEHYIEWNCILNNEIYKPKEENNED